MSSTPEDAAAAPLPEANATVLKRCFIITPIGSSQSATRRAADGVIAAAIKPALGKDYDAKAAHNVVGPGSITNDIIERVLESDLVIADLTGLNPNVMYEMAVRHATGKPMITIADSTTQFPFDVKDERIIVYTNDMQGVVDLREALIEAIAAINISAEYENPITRVSKRILIENSLPEKTVNSILLDKLDQIESSLFRIEHSKASDNVSYDFISNFVVDRSKWDMVRNYLENNAHLVSFRAGKANTREIGMYLDFKPGAPFTEVLNTLHELGVKADDYPVRQW